jgi:DNA adenine methylase
MSVMFGSLVSRWKLRPPLKTHGGKAYLARRIISLMPLHRTFVEPFLGGGSVLLNKVRSFREIGSDIDPDLMNFWTVLRDDQSFLDRVRETLYSRTVFDQVSTRSLLPTSPSRRAWEFFVRKRMSRDGLGKDFAWSERLRGGQPGDVNAWKTIQEELVRIRDRIELVEFHCGPAVPLIADHDSPGTVIYCDPPYLHETRTTRNAYAHEMTYEDHQILLGCLLCCRGTVFLSGYRSSLYDAALAGWTRHEFDMPNHSGQGKTKQRRVECLWINRYHADSA